MSKRLELRLDTNLFDKIEIYRIEKNLEDKQDAIREILKKQLNKKSWFEKLKNIFK